MLINTRSDLCTSAGLLMVASWEILCHEFRWLWGDSSETLGWILEKGEIPLSVCYAMNRHRGMRRTEEAWVGMGRNKEEWVWRGGCAGTGCEWAVEEESNYSVLLSYNQNSISSSNKDRWEARILRGKGPLDFWVIHSCDSIGSRHSMNHCRKE